MRKPSRLWIIVLLPAMVVAGVGCQTVRQHPVASGAVIGAAGGALAGGAVGHQKGKSTEGALIGAAAGAAIGAGVGYLFGRQSEEFDEIEGVEVEKVDETASTPAHLKLRMSNEILFDPDSSALKADGVATVGEIAQVMREYPDTHVIVKGYASAEGSDAHNLELSKQRAEMVASQMIANRVMPDRITAMGLGESSPIADNSTELGRMRNRRVEIDVFPSEDRR